MYKEENGTRCKREKKQTTATLVLRYSLQKAVHILVLDTSFSLLHKHNRKVFTKLKAFVGDGGRKTRKIKYIIFTVMC